MITEWLLFLFFLGYSFSIFGKAPSDLIICLIYVSVYSFIIILLEKIISIVVSKVIYREDIEIKYEEIQDRADTIMTSKELNDMFEQAKKNVGL